jgi:hypothetical protein
MDLNCDGTIESIAGVYVVDERSFFMMSKMFRMTNMFMAGMDTDDGVPLNTADQSLRVKQEVRRLEANLAKALLINEALWEIIKEKHQMKEEQLYEKIYEMDMRDGVLDGQNQRKKMDCPKCGRVVAPRYSACIYCGHVIDDSVFQMG